MAVLTFETCWVVNGEMIKRVTSSWSIVIQLSTYMHRDVQSLAISHKFINFVQTFLKCGVVLKSIYLILIYMYIYKDSKFLKILKIKLKENINRHDIYLHMH
jgi:hypothetical protein